jgi:DNA-directed RNA polymerase specialized sigma24 family protein
VFHFAERPPIHHGEIQDAKTTENHQRYEVQYEALAETLNIPLGTVKTHLYRAKRRLRELLEE